GATADDAVAVAQRVREVLAEPVLVNGHQLSVQGSVGATVGRIAVVDALLRDADEAMYEAKRAGKAIMVHADAVSSTVTE
ncbi:MAG TPA: diguanylate cyclase, partial [Micromonosporaceae bacterium]